MPMQRNVNRDFFKAWTPEMAYVLGFFAADGNLMKNKRGACFFSLEICDRDILEKIKNTMGSNHLIGIRKFSNKTHQKRYRLQIGSREIYTDLRSLGFSANKTHNMAIPHVPVEYFGDFLRGYFDGDGNVWSGFAHKERKASNPSLLVAFTSSSRIFLEGIFERLKKRGVTQGGSLIDYDTYHRISYATLDSLKIYSFMYNGERYGSLHLSRKKAVFDRFIADSRVCGCSSTVEHSPVDIAAFRRNGGLKLSGITVKAKLRSEACEHRGNPSIFLP